MAGELFDLIVTNPPFVISPATGERLVYRDSGLPGDRVVEDIVRTVPEHLAPGGTGQVLANWAIKADQPWDERLAELAAPTRGCDAWVVQREILDLAVLRRALAQGRRRCTERRTTRRRYDTWLSWFEEIGIEAVGFGWINLRSTRLARRPDLRLEDWRWEVEQPLGPEIDRHFARVAGCATSTTTRSSPAARVLRPRRGPGDLRRRRVPRTPSQIVLRRQTGMRRAAQVDTVGAALAGAADGELTVGQLLAAIAELVGEARRPADRGST